MNDALSFVSGPAAAAAAVPDPTAPAAAASQQERGGPLQVPAGGEGQDHRGLETGRKGKIYDHLVIYATLFSEEESVFLRGRAENCER